MRVFGRRNRRGDSFGSEGSGVRGTSTSGIAFDLMLSSSKGHGDASPFVLHSTDTGSEGDRASS